MIQIGVIQVILVGVDVIRINVIQYYRISAPKFFNFKIILALSILEMLLSPGFFISLFSETCHDELLSEISDLPLSNMPKLQIFIGEVPSPLLCPAFPDISVPPDCSTTLQTCNLWRYDPSGSWWFHRNSVIYVPPEINDHFITTFLTNEVELPITVSP